METTTEITGYRASRRGCHALACVVLRVPVKAIAISDGAGGVVMHRKVDPWRTAMVTVAPYVISLSINAAVTGDASHPSRLAAIDCAVSTWSDHRTTLPFISESNLA